ncbi:MAG: PAS domain S-box protein, partial [Proteobacteria bacterium]|nr:PAS domain S-box protein [Pseudomonadota bacterium]
MKEKRGTVLVIDDEPATLGILFEHLRQANFRVLIAEDGASALERVKRLPPDIILLDIKLPDTNGFEVHNRLKEHAATQDTPIIFMTAMTETANKVKAFDLDAADYITKPFQPAEVVARVEKHLTIHKLQKRLEEQNAQLEREVAERVRVEQELKVSESKYKSLFDNSGTSIVLLDKSGNYLAVNAQAAQTLGGKPKDFETKSLFDLFPEEIAQEYVEANRKIIETGVGREYTKTFSLPTGQRTYLIIEQAVQDSSGAGVAIQSSSIDITKRVQVENELTQSNQLLETIFDHTHMLVAYLDPQLNFIRVNRAYAEADKREPSFFPGKNHFDLYPNAENEAIFCRVVETGEPHFTHAKPFEYAENPERGVTHWDWSLIPTQDKGAVTGLVLTLANVTARVQAEEALHKSDARYRAVVQAQTDLIYRYTPNGTVTFANDAYCQFYGKALDEIIGTNHFDKIPDEERKAASKHIASLSAAKPLGTNESRNVNSRGESYWIHWTDQAIFDHDDNVIEYQAVGHDITERVRAEKELESIFDSTGYLICVADIQGHFKRLNASWEQTLGYSPKELMSKPFLDFVHPDDRDETMAVIQEKLSQGIEVMQFENRYRCQDGSYKWLSWTSRPVVEEDIVYAIAYDVTERVQAEARRDATLEALRESEE